MNFIHHFGTALRPILTPRFEAAFLLIGAISFPVLADAQIQEAWVERYDNGISEGTNQAVKMALDSNANILVTGFSQNSDTNLGYATVKFAPNGSPQWVVRFDSTNSPTAVPAALALDISNNVFITGSALTVKYDSNGDELWTAPYAGSSMGIDTNGNVAVSGFISANATVKLSPSGSNVWLNTYPSSPYWGSGVPKAVAMDVAGETYVAGEYPFDSDEFELLLVKYGIAGNQLWTASYREASTPLSVGTLSIDSAGNAWIVEEALEVSSTTLKFGVEGNLVWVNFSPIENCGDDDPHVLALDYQGDAIVTGTSCYHNANYTFTATVFATYKSNTNGNWAWTNVYPVKPVASSTSTSIAVDSLGNSYVTGWAIIGSTTDIVTIAYGPNGNQLWLQTYAAPSGGNAVGNAIAVDNAGNVYVAGYEDTGAGGTEFVLIKYSPMKLQKNTNGSMLLQTEGSPGETFTIESSPDLLNWSGIGTAIADTNGLMQFTDTNAPNYPARFYNTIPQ